jgi:hypothetical protein
LFHELVDYAAVLIVPSLLLGIVAGLVLTGLAASVPNRSRIVRAGCLVLGTLLAAGSAWVVLYAAGPDSYYEPMHYSRWEHAGRFLGTSPVVFAVIGGFAASFLLFASARGPTRRVLRLAAGPAASLACLLLLLGWFALTAGH